MKGERLHPRLLLDPVHFFALGFGAGLSPWAPGTAGTLIAVPIVLALGGLDWMLQVFVVAAFVAVGIPICGASAKKLGCHDHSAIVWDEIAGFAITMLAAPRTWRWMAAGFLIFRFFDIVKPWPIREADHRLTGGLGIMLDDVLAGAIAGLALYASNKWI